MYSLFKNKDLLNFHNFREKRNSWFNDKRTGELSVAKEA